MPLSVQGALMISNGERKEGHVIGKKIVIKDNVRIGKSAE